MTFTDYPYNNLRNKFGAHLTDKGFDLLNRYVVVLQDCSCLSPFRELAYFHAPILVRYSRSKLGCSPIRQQDRYPRWHTYPGKILVARSIGKNGNRTACKWKVSFFIIFTWSVSKYIMYVIAVAGGHRKSRCKWKLIWIHGFGINNCIFFYFSGFWLMIPAGE